MGAVVRDSRLLFDTRCWMFDIPCLFAGRVRLVCVPPPPPCWVGEVVCVSNWTLTKEKEGQATETETAGEKERVRVLVCTLTGTSYVPPPHILPLPLPIHPFAVSPCAPGPRQNRCVSVRLLQEQRKNYACFLGAVSGA